MSRDYLVGQEIEQKRDMKRRIKHELRIKKNKVFVCFRTW